MLVIAVGVHYKSLVFHSQLTVNTVSLMKNTEGPKSSVMNCITQLSALLLVCVFHLPLLCHTRYNHPFRVMIHIKELRGHVNEKYSLTLTLKNVIHSFMGI